MKIRCKKTKRFLCEIDIESYLKHLEELGISQEIPLKITIPCRRCQKVEVYNIYKDHYSFVENENA
jgi:phage FluMu protein Com